MIKVECKSQEVNAVTAAEAETGRLYTTNLVSSRQTVLIRGPMARFIALDDGWVYSPGIRAFPVSPGTVITLTQED